MAANLTRFIIAREGTKRASAGLVGATVIAGAAADHTVFPKRLVGATVITSATATGPVTATMAGASVLASAAAAGLNPAAASLVGATVIPPTDANGFGIASASMTGKTLAGGAPKRKIKPRRRESQFLYHSL